jgi:hypothetical protein
LKTNLTFPDPSRCASALRPGIMRMVRKVFALETSAYFTCSPRLTASPALTSWVDEILYISSSLNQVLQALTCLPLDDGWVKHLKRQQPDPQQSQTRTLNAGLSLPKKAPTTDRPPFPRKAPPFSLPGGNACRGGAHRSPIPYENPRTPEEKHVKNSVANDCKKFLDFANAEGINWRSS